MPQPTDLLPELWTLIVEHCIVQPPPALDKSTAKCTTFVAQPTLAALMRVNLVRPSTRPERSVRKRMARGARGDKAMLESDGQFFHELAWRRLYRHVSVVDIPSLSYGLPMPPPPPDAPEFLPEPQDRDESSPTDGPPHPRRPDKLKLLSRIVTLHIPDIIRIDQTALIGGESNPLTPDAQDRTTRTAETTIMRWGEMRHVFSCYTHAGYTSPAHKLFPRVETLRFGPVPQRSRSLSAAVYEYGGFAPLFIPLTAAHSVCDRDGSGLLGHSLPVHMRHLVPYHHRPNDASDQPPPALLTYIQHADPYDGLATLWGARNVIYISRRSSFFADQEADHEAEQMTEAEREEACVEDAVRCVDEVLSGYRFGAFAGDTALTRHMRERTSVELYGPVRRTPEVDPYGVGVLARLFDQVDESMEEAEEADEVEETAQGDARRWEERVCEVVQEQARRAIREEGKGNKLLLDHALTVRPTLGSKPCVVCGEDEGRE